ncbi:MAG: phosphoglycerate kinase [Planctomycetota bacterium]|nr:phosphoglycerate kinase [Planctomycetota bacterium]MDI6787333.1 phosphoglycerate kinase [Planctomycetota bacterium]
MDKLTIKDMDIADKRVLTRVDYNVPMDEKGNITDDNRIRSTLPTLNYILNNKGKLVLMTHLGRPKGKDAKLKVDNIARRLEEILKRPVKKMDDCIGETVEKSVSKMKEGEVILLENLRFYPEEEANNNNFSKKLAFLGDLYINDAFACSHRAHASIVGVTRYLKSGAGLLLAKEIEYLYKLKESPHKPYVAILGGAKVSDKITVIENLLNMVDIFLVGGGMAYTFLKAQGKNIGSSKLEKDYIEVASKLLASARAKKVEIVLPVDHLVTDHIDSKGRIKIEKGEISEGFSGVDIGPETIKLFSSKLQDARTVIWNGPLGIFENDKFSEGTRSVAHILSSLNATTVIGGGETVAAADKFAVAHKMSHISTGGGAFLEFMEGKELPGIAALTNK